MKINRYVVVALCALLFAVLACGPLGPTANPDVDVPDTVGDMRAFWTSVTNVERDMTAQYEILQRSYNNDMLTVIDQNTVAQECWTNFTEVATQATAGRYDQVDADGNPTGQFDEQAFINALVVNEAYPGDPSECQRQQSEVQRSIAVWRADNTDAWEKMYSFRTTHQQLLFSDPLQSIVLREGADLARDLRNNFETQFGDDYFFPTFNLQSQNRNRTMCDWYTDADQVAEGYVAEWNGGIRSCTYYGKAAFEVMFQPFASAEVQTRFDCGEDAGAFDEVEDCDGE